jgi:hypothetical protein
MAKVSDLVPPMLEAFRESLAEDFPKAKAFAKPELERLAKVLLDIVKLETNGDITPLEAAHLLRIHRLTTLNVLTTIQGLGIIAVENAVNAALDAIKGQVNALLPFPLL